MSQFDRGGKGLTNEKRHPYIVELAVTADGLDVGLSRRIINFHKSLRIELRFGRRILRDEQNYYRWCFSDLATARAFIKQFGGQVCDAPEDTP
jgi:hypothetical protein